MVKAASVYRNPRAFNKLQQPYFTENFWLKFQDIRKAQRIWFIPKGVTHDYYLVFVKYLVKLETLYYLFYFYCTIVRGNFLELWKFLDYGRLITLILE